MITRIPVQTLRNIGSETAQDLKAVGILYLDQLEELGMQSKLLFALWKGANNAGSKCHVIMRCIFMPYMVP